MKKYTTPEMKIVSYLPEENMAANENLSAQNNGGSNLYNDAEFGSW